MGAPKLCVINLFAGPGAGKSTTAVGLFFKMKCAGHNVELVTEYAKELVYQNSPLLRFQEHVTNQQIKRQQRLVGNVQFAITDSPLLLGLVYGERDPWWLRDEANALLETWKEFDNISFFIDRVKPYQPYGRRQSEASARAVDQKVLQMLHDHAIPFTRIQGDENAPDRILEILTTPSFNEEAEVQHDRCHGTPNWSCPRCEFNDDAPRTSKDLWRCACGA